MIHETFIVYDTKSETFTLPFFQQKKQMALRTFKNWVNDPNHTFGMNPEDYTLFHTGQYDDSMGVFNPLETKEALAIGTQLLEQNQ